MFKNSVFKDTVSTKKWFINAGIRAMKTFCQTAVAMITAGQMITELNWEEVLGVSATAAVISILTSLAGIPEVESEE